MDPSRAQHERRHFAGLLKAAGTSWWGNETPAGAARQDIRAKLAAEYLGLRPGMRLLEIGCALGEFSRRLGMWGAEVVAIDISRELVSCAAKRVTQENVRFEVADCHKLPCADCSFDAAAGNAILHHLELDSVLGELWRVLRPGGRMIFAEPNILNPQVLLSVKVRFIGRMLDCTPDETAFYRRRLAGQLARAGFVEREVQPFDFLHPWTPPFLIGAVSAMGGVLERLPLVREISGSLLITARKPV